MVIFFLGCGSNVNLSPQTPTQKCHPLGMAECSRLPAFAYTFLQGLDLAHVQALESGGSGTRRVSFDARADHAHSL